MEQELYEIARQLRELSARLDALMAAAAPAAVPPAAEPAEEPHLEEMPLAEEEPLAEEPAVSVAPGPVKLTVNDRYRFMRELFDGDAEALTCALAEVGSLASAAEVESYVTEVLGLEPERQEVADFLAVTTERLKPRPTLLA